MCQQMWRDNNKLLGMQVSQKTLKKSFRGRGMPSIHRSYLYNFIQLCWYTKMLFKENPCNSWFCLLLLSLSLSLFLPNLFVWEELIGTKPEDIKVTHHILILHSWCLISFWQSSRYVCIPLWIQSLMLH